MDHAPAPSWLDSHLDSRPGWADVPAEGVVIDPVAAVPETALGEAAAPAGDSWLDDATIGGLADDVDQIEITDADLAADLATDVTVDDEFAIPAEQGPDTEPNLIDPFDEFVAETDTTADTLPDPHVDDGDEVDEVDDLIEGDVDGDDIAPLATDDMSDPTTTEPDVVTTLDDEQAAVTSDDGDPGSNAFDSFDVAPDRTTDADAVADGIGDADRSWAPEPGDHAAADTGYDAFDGLDEGTDG